MSDIEVVRKSLIRRNKSDISEFEYGKLPPQHRDLEEAVIGAVLIEKDAIEDVVSFVIADCFYVDAHQRIWKAILNLYEKNEPIDILTVTQQLRENSDLDAVGGAFFIAQLSNRVGSASNVEYHARIVVEAYIKRKTISISSETIKDAYEDTSDAFDVLDKAGRDLSVLSENRFGSSSQTIGSSLMQELDGIEKRMSMGEHELTGITSGFTELDRITGGWQKSDLIIVAGRAAMGKTAATLNFARHAAIIDKKSVAFFSLEMSTSQLTQRLISGEAEIFNDKIRSGKLNHGEWGRLTGSLDYLRDAKIVIDDTPALSIIELKARARSLKKEHGIDMIVIDYMQLMSGIGGKMEGNREQEISSISRGLKALAKELNIPVIALSQLSRAVETRGGEKKPILSDLRESGSIEQDADIVIFLYRPEYYGFDTDVDGNPTKGIGYFNVAKHRNGELKEIKVGFDGCYTKFKNYIDGGGDSGGGYTVTQNTESSNGVSPAMKKFRTRSREESDQTTPTNESSQMSSEDIDSVTPF